MGITSERRDLLHPIKGEGCKEESFCGRNPEKEGGDLGEGCGGGGGYVIHFDIHFLNTSKTYFGYAPSQTH